GASGNTARILTESERRESHPLRLRRGSHRIIHDRTINARDCPACAKTKDPRGSTRPDAEEPVTLSVFPDTRPLRRRERRAERHHLAYAGAADAGCPHNAGTDASHLFRADGAGTTKHVDDRAAD